MHGARRRYDFGAGRVEHHVRASGEGVAVAMTLAYLDELYEAMTNRDQRRVRYLIAAARASWIPRAVREEVLAIVRLPRASVRAPIQLLRYMQTLEELSYESDVASPPADDDVDPTQLELPGVS